MKLTLRYFASMKEQMDCDQESLIVDETVTKVGALKQYLMIHHPQFATACAQVGRVRMAVNQDMADEETALSDGAEVAFFPPVTGG